MAEHAAENVRIKRTYAEWMEDAICVTIPRGVTVTDDELHDQVEQLYAGAMDKGDIVTAVEIETAAGTVTVGASLFWEGEHRTAVDMLDDVWEIEERWRGAEPLDAWAEDDEFPVDDWRYEVANDDTRLGYVEWVQHRREAEGSTS